MKVSRSVNSVLWSVAALVSCFLCISHTVAGQQRDASGNCLLFPGGPFQKDVSAAPVLNDVRLLNFSLSMAPDTELHADFYGQAGDAYYGIPYSVVDTRQPADVARIPSDATEWTAYADESDNDTDWQCSVHSNDRCHTYPFPLDAPIEGAYPGCPPKDWDPECGGDRHVLVVDAATCSLYEAWHCTPPASMDDPWRCGNGVVFNLSKPWLPQRTMGWTSGDAAGLPLLPGLVTLADVRSGAIAHAIRFTMGSSNDAYAYPASHRAGYNNPGYPWMGMRVRLRGSFSCGGLATNLARMVCAAMKKYGMILADNGSSWYFQGEAASPDDWSALVSVAGQPGASVEEKMDAFHADMRSIYGRDFEAVMLPGEDCLCGMRDDFTLDRNDDYCQVCTCGQCPPPIPGKDNNTPASPSPQPSPPPPSPKPNSKPSPSPKPATASPSPPPAVKPSPSPPPGPSSGHDGPKLALQTGRALKALNGSMVAYNGTIDAGISTQGVADYNNFQGYTELWPHAKEYDAPQWTVSDDVDAGYSARVLLKFAGLGTYMAAAANIVGAKLTLTFLSWDAGVTLQVCALRTDWYGISPPLQEYALGWKSTGMLNGQSTPIAWTSPGGWGDCDPAHTWTLPLPDAPSTAAGVTNVSLPLPAALLKAWLAAERGPLLGQGNAGLLIRSPTKGSPALLLSQYSDEPAYRPLLEVTCGCSGSACSSCWAGAPPPAGQPLRNADGSCVLFPASHAINRPVNGANYAVHPNSTRIIAAINKAAAAKGQAAAFKADFVGGTVENGRNIYYGIPINYVDTSPAKGLAYPRRRTQFSLYADESDNGTYPFPLAAAIEGAYPGCPPSSCTGDRHVLAIDNATCTLWEAANCIAPSSLAAPWACSGGARFNLSSPRAITRRLGWTSAEAGGMAITPGLVKLAELRQGAIRHALRFTAPIVLPAYQFPASHLVRLREEVPPDAPWLGMRLRLRAGYDCSPAGKMTTRAGRIVCTALKKYGAILADVGSAYFLTGEASPGWPAVLQQLGSLRDGSTDAFLDDIRRLQGSDTEVVVPHSAVFPSGCLCWRPDCRVAPGGPLKCSPLP
ncbi:hypothetical protein OEZ85_014466 [Tetradesmus obliquus]|uniref:Uncharacterized protein n=1 Tax=Tetradesmus obliquus TaxID=3088 RepID=A0ABY8UAL0_TETOB|nr:hypothetical protein OEZ85_014466 [Tetradesmus obliquus]